MTRHQRTIQHPPDRYHRFTGRSNSWCQHSRSRSRARKSYCHNRCNSRDCIQIHRSPSHSRLCCSIPYLQDSLILNPNHIYLNMVTNSTLKEGILLTDTATDGHTLFHTTTQLITKADTKALGIKIAPTVQANTILLSHYRQIPPQGQQVRQAKAGSPKSTDNAWVSHTSAPQSFIREFIKDVQYISQPVIYPAKFYIFKDISCHPNLLSYPASDHLGILEFKVPNKAPATIIDAVRKHKT